MVDGINFNPFTMQAWSAEEVSELDVNKDGVISEDEVKQKWSWLSGSDNENDVNLDNNLEKAAKNAGMTDTARTTQELIQNIAILADEYIEQYMSNHPELTDSERLSVQNQVSVNSNLFVNEYIVNNPTGPYDMSKIISNFEAAMDKAITDNKEALKQVNDSIKSYIDNTDTNFESMFSTTDKALKNNNISNSEWNQIKNKTVQYLMGVLLSDDANTEFLSNIHKNYSKNSYYKEALNIVNKIKNSEDPTEIQTLLNDLQNALNKFLEAAGKDNVSNGIIEYSNAKNEEAISQKLNDIKDAWLEDNITSDMSDDEKSNLRAFVDSCVSKFIAKLAEDDSMSDITDNLLKNQFIVFVQREQLNLSIAQKTLEKDSNDIQQSYNNLVNTADSANANGNISKEEKSEIVDAAVELIINQLLSGVEKLQFLQALNGNYQSSTDFKNLKSLITQMKSSSDSAEIDKLYEQAIEIATKMLNSFSGEKLSEAVKYIKPVEIQGSDKDNVIFNSSIYAVYKADASRTSSYGKQNDDSLAQIQQIARDDMRAVAEAIKAQLKNELGSAYNEEEIQKYIDDAINDTISIFTQNVQRTKKGDDYAVGNDQYGFIFLRKGGTKSGRYTYNVQALTNTFIDKFNEVSKNRKVVQMDPSLVTYDKENVINESVGNEYNRNKEIEDSDKSSIYANALAKLKQVATAIKSSLLAEGCTVSSSVIDSILEESMSETMENYEFAENTELINSNTYWNDAFGPYSVTTYSYLTKNLVDDFFQRVDTKLEKAKEQE